MLHRVTGSLTFLTALATLFAACGDGETTPAAQSPLVEVHVEETTLESGGAVAGVYAISSASGVPYESVPNEELGLPAGCRAIPFSTSGEIDDFRFVAKETEAFDAGTILAGTGPLETSLGYSPELNGYDRPSLAYPEKQARMPEPSSEWAVELVGGSSAQPVSATAATPDPPNFEWTVRDGTVLVITSSDAAPFDVQLETYEEERDLFITCRNNESTFEWNFESITPRWLRVARTVETPLDLPGADATFYLSQGLEPRLRDSGAPQWVVATTAQTVEVDGTLSLTLDVVTGRSPHEAPRFEATGCRVEPLDYDTGPPVDIGEVVLTAGPVDLVLPFTDSGYGEASTLLESPVTGWSARSAGSDESPAISGEFRFGPVPDSATITVGTDTVTVEWTGMERAHFGVEVGEGASGERLLCSNIDGGSYTWEKTVAPGAPVSGWVGNHRSRGFASWGPTMGHAQTLHRREAVVQ